MRFVTFEHKGHLRFGVVDGQGIVDLSQRLGEFASLRDLLTANGRSRVERFLGRGRSDHGLSDLAYRPVIPNPDKILGVGINYRGHGEETGKKPADYPTLFVRFPSSQVGHGQALVKPRESAALDYEGEIAIVIGKPGRRIPLERAFDYIAGFSCYNDGSVRDFQRHSSQFTPGKNFVGSGAFGPWLVTRDEIEDPAELTITTRLNGVEMQHAKASEMIFSFDAIVAYCSVFTELLPGDVITTGTPAGVGVARKPPVFLKPGDAIEVEVSGVGILSNSVSEG